MSTRDQILASAWKLFGERGFEDVSVRDVTNEAGVNLASVSYHFGSKDGLIQEVVKKVLNPANQHRVDLLEGVVAEAGGVAGGVANVTLVQIIESYIRPVMFPDEHGSNRDIMARLAARYLIERNYDVPNSVLALFAEVFQKYVLITSTKVGHLSHEEILQRLMFGIGAALHYQSFAALANKIAGREPIPDREKDFRELVKFVHAGFGS